MFQRILSSPLRPAHPSSLEKNNYTFGQYYKMLTTSPQILVPELHGHLLLLQDEAIENSKIVQEWNDLMFVDQGPRRICTTCAFLSMLCKLLSKQGIKVKATSMLQQMDTAGARWLAGAGTQPAPAELEKFMEETWFRSEGGIEFMVSIATSVCFNPECTLERDKRNKTTQTSYKNVLFRRIRESCTQTKFVLGVVNLLPVFVHGANMSNTKILHPKPRPACHVLGLLSADRTRVTGWNSWGGSSKLLHFPLQYILSFIEVRVTQIKVRDSAQGVTCLMDTEPLQESDWCAHSTLYSAVERHMLTSWLGCDEQLYYRQVSKCVKLYASQPMRKTAMKQEIKPLPAPAHNSDSTRNRPQKKRRTGRD